MRKRLVASNTSNTSWVGMQRGPAMTMAPHGAVAKFESCQARFLIRFARQVKVREDAVDVWRHDLARRADVRFVEFVIAGDAKE